MKRSAVFLLLACLLVAPLRAEPLGKAIEITAPAGWKSVAPLEPGQPQPPFPILRYVPTDGRNASVLLTLLPATVPGHEVTDLASLKRFNLMASRPYLPSPDATPTATELTVPGGIGVYLTNEDPALVGKPVPPNEYRIATTATVLIDGQYLIHATVFYDEHGSADFKEGLKILLSASTHETNPPI
jgi:hypothetical protein